MGQHTLHRSVIAAKYKYYSRSLKLLLLLCLIIFELFDLQSCPVLGREDLTHSVRQRDSISADIEHGPVILSIFASQFGYGEFVVQHFKDESVFSSSIECVHFATAWIVFKNES